MNSKWWVALGIIGVFLVTQYLEETRTSNYLPQSEVAESSSNGGVDTSRKYSDDVRTSYLEECASATPGGEQGAFCACSLQFHEVAMPEKLFLEMLETMASNSMLTETQKTAQKFAIYNCTRFIENDADLGEGFRDYWFESCPTNGLSEQQCSCLLEGLNKEFTNQQLTEHLYAGIWQEYSAEQKEKQQRVVDRCS